MTLGLLLINTPAHSPDSNGANLHIRLACLFDSPCQTWQSGSQMMPCELGVPCLTVPITLTHPGSMLGIIQQGIEGTSL